MTPKTVFAALAAGLALLAVTASPMRPQETPAGPRTQEAAPPSVQVAVGVYNGAQFVRGLTRADFELLENGEPQKIEALYEVDRNAVTRQEGNAAAAPVTARRFYLLFQLIDYNARIADALRYFFTNALLPGDSLYVQTPMKTYRLTPEALAQRPREVLAKEMDNIVRKDINQGNLLYRSLVRELRRIVGGLEGLNPVAGGDEASDTETSELGVEQLLNMYRDSLTKFETLRAFDQDKVLGFAQGLKKQDGRKLVFFIYEQEFRPEISPQMINALIDNNQDKQNVIDAVHELFQIYHQNISLDAARIAQAYCDSSADFNLLFMAKTPERIGGITMREQSDVLFRVFSQVAKATGGFIETTQNPLTAIRDGLGAAEYYYLLTYVPSSATKNAGFKTIAVKVKDKNYKVLNRRGYISG